MMNNVARMDSSRNCFSNPLVTPGQPISTPDHCEAKASKTNQRSFRQQLYFHHVWSLELLFSVMSAVQYMLSWMFGVFRLGLGFLVFLILALRRLVACVVALSFRLRIWHRRRVLQLADDTFPLAVLTGLLYSPVCNSVRFFLSRV